MLSVIILIVTNRSVIMLSVIVLSVIMLSVIMLSLIMLSVIILSVVMPNVLASFLSDSNRLLLSFVDKNSCIKTWSAKLSVRLKVN